jgi:hypothetical protein
MHLRGPHGQINHAMQAQAAKTVLFVQETQFVAVLATAAAALGRCI